MNHTISFRRPELRYVLSKMTVPPDADMAMQIRRLTDLGYTIVDVSPPLECYGPPQKSQQFQLFTIGQAMSSPDNTPR